jgi:ABC-type transporter Mla MlaB component
MKSDRPIGHGGTGKRKRTGVDDSRTELNRARACSDIERSGEWMAAEELRDAALGALELGGDVTVNVGKVDHLDASALQILLALDAEQKKRRGHLQLVNASEFAALV